MYPTGAELGTEFALEWAFDLTPHTTGLGRFTDWLIPALAQDLVELADHGRLARGELAFGIELGEESGPIALVDSERFHRC